MMMIAAALLACADAPPSTWADPPGAASRRDLPEPLPPAPEGGGGDLSGPCEASALAPWEEGWVVADNEDAERLYAFDAQFVPRAPVPLAQEVGDIESLAVGDDGLWVVGSHSTTADGEIKEKRERILRPDGTVVTLDLTACPRCERMRGVPPEGGGFNVEGAAWHDGQLWLGVRSPLSEAGDALILAVDETGRVEGVLEVDLDGAGVRALVPDVDGLWVVAGPTTDADEPHALWRLDPTGFAEHVPVDLPPAEGAALLPGADGVLVYVTDGAGTPEDCRKPGRWGRIKLP